MHSVKPIFKYPIGLLFICLLNLGCKKTIPTPVRNGAFQVISNNYGVALRDIEPTADGGYYILAETLIHGNKDGWLIKMDANNQQVWQKVFGSKYDETFVQIVIDSAENVIAAGNTVGYGRIYDSLSNGTLSSDAYIYCCNKNGTTLWEKNHYCLGNNLGIGYDLLKNIIVLPNRKYAFCGTTRNVIKSGIYSQTGWVVILDEMGMKTNEYLVDTVNIINTLTENPNHNLTFEGYQFLKTPKISSFFQINPTQISGNNIQFGVCTWPFISSNAAIVYEEMIRIGPSLVNHYQGYFGYNYLVSYEYNSDNYSYYIKNIDLPVTYNAIKVNADLSITCANENGTVKSILDGQIEFSINYGIKANRILKLKKNRMLISIENTNKIELYITDYTGKPWEN